MQFTLCNFELPLLRRMYVVATGQVFAVPTYAPLRIFDRNKDVLIQSLVLIINP